MEYNEMGELIFLKIAKLITPEQEKKLDAWLTADPANQAVLDRIRDRDYFFPGQPAGKQKEINDKVREIRAQKKANGDQAGSNDKS